MPILYDRVVFFSPYINAFSCILLKFSLFQYLSLLNDVWLLINVYRHGALLLCWSGVFHQHFMQL